MAAERRWHGLGDLHVALAAGAATSGVWSRSVAVVAICALLAVVVCSRWFVGLLCLLLGIAGVARSVTEWQAVAPDRLGHYAGWATVVGDPAPFGRGLRVTLDIEGERYDAWVYGSPRRRLVDRQAGERVYVEGVRRQATSHVRRVQVRHVVGMLEVDVVGDWSEGWPLHRASTRVRNALRRSAEGAMGADDGALFTGLVIGDDSRQAPAMVAAFRTAGLSHLTAVSGQNVAFVLAAFSPVLRRCRPWWRWAVTLALIGWFMALTRFEPSVLRAGMMAMLGASAMVLGSRQSVVRLLGLAVTVLVIVDPMLVWSVGFWLSTGATVGVAVLAPALARRLPGPGWLTMPLSVSLGAQIGVAVPSWLVFHRLPLTSVPANLLAVPVAGFVMLYGIPAGLISGVVPPLATIIMAPCVVGTRWVAAVAYVAAGVEPVPRVAAAGWLAIVAVVGALVIRHHWRASVGDVPI